MILPQLLRFSFLISALTCLRCAGEPTAVPAAPASREPVFRFSRQDQITGRSEAQNWCYRPYSQAVPVSARLENSNQRFFDLPPGVYRLIVPFGKLTASIMLRSRGAGQPIEVFTSDHFPECLSNAANFQISPDGASLSYDNRLGIRFALSAQPNGTAMRAFLDLPLGAAYGTEVRLCDKCAD
ncbi:MAG: hypothetical protein ACR2K1_13770 [Saprospiraceae bacterium]